MPTVKLSRSGDAPLLFAGDLVAAAEGQRQLDREHNRWHDLAVYTRDGGQYAVAIRYETRWTGETGHAEARLVQDAAGVRQVLRQYDPTAHVAVRRLCTDDAQH